MIEVAWSKNARTDLERLKRWRKSYAQEVYRILREELAVNGYVGDEYKPHVLANPNSRFSGCMEFHAFDDVLVLYYPSSPDGFVRIVRVCTHGELSSGRFHAEWPSARG
ncbi:type II toxin-antitoxin system YafQ family toxin [Bifidobacterium jacchi]|uniref:Type II toxin-antitoxin system RelE/ParE family toxin n=1 Tax=Bifidobacterium jacchi TaxID=2490545 RepID=A0A5N5RGS0_9BIFI|nr:type II toxin-antitoxin system YafQ family toxin [Bifidobacterium jacchi]KAB5606423.1 hypothetical protein EHS19_07380 [Bifidobacterium jacchi]